MALGTTCCDIRLLLLFLLPKPRCSTWAKSSVQTHYGQCPDRSVGTELSGKVSPSEAGAKEARHPDGWPQASLPLVRGRGLEGRRYSYLKNFIKTYLSLFLSGKSSKSAKNSIISPTSMFFSPNKLLLIFKPS